MAVFVLCASTATPAAIPSPTPSASPRATASPLIRRAIVSCGKTPFYVWPARDIAPSGSSYPGARYGDAFNVIGDGVLAPSGANLTETTIDVVEPWGQGKHYWIASQCID